MDNAYIGAVIAWPNNYEPKNWKFCHGQKMLIDDNPALYAVIGTLYGGDDIVCFNLPDLRGRTVVGECERKGPRKGRVFGYEKTKVLLPVHNHSVDKKGDSYCSNVDLEVTTDEIPVKLTGTYGVPITDSLDGALSIPSDSEHYLGKTKLPNNSPVLTYHKSNTQPTITTKPTTIKVTGNAEPVFTTTSFTNSKAKIDLRDAKVIPEGIKNASISLLQPSLVLNYIICVDGYFPSRGW